jgi:F-box and leucine-rich repeat protein 9
LSINSCDISTKNLQIALASMKNLSRLNISNSRELFMTCGLFKDNDLMLEKVESLSLQQNQYLSDAQFWRVTQAMPNLKSLDLSSNSIQFHRGLYKKFYPKHNDCEVGSDNVFTFHFIRKFIEKRGETLKELHFNSTLIDGDTLQLLSEIVDLKLDKLSLRQCDQLTNDGFVTLIKVQQNLTELDLTFSVRITDKSVMEICESLKSLKVLKLRKCRAITDVSVKMIANLPQLEVLDISECELITSASIIEGIARERNENLREVHLSALNICDKAITKVTENLVNLRVLDLSYCFNHVDDVCVQMILKNLVMLRELNLDFCERISDGGLTGMTMKEKIDEFESTSEQESDKHEPVVSGSIPLPIIAPPLFKISLRTKAEEAIVGDALRKKAMMQMAVKINLDEQSSSNFSIARLTGLRKLNLGSCNKISDVSLIYNFKLPELREINLSKCQQISIDGIKALVDNCPALEVVNLSECHNISDKCIELISTKLPRLTTLNLQRCYQLSDYSLDYIAMNCKRIRELNVLGCRNMSDEPHLRFASNGSLNISFSKPGPYRDVSGPVPPAPRMQGGSRIPFPLPFRY